MRCGGGDSQASGIYAYKLSLVIHPHFTRIFSASLFDISQTDPKYQTPATALLRDYRSTATRPYQGWEFDNRIGHHWSTFPAPLEALLRTHCPYSPKIYTHARSGGGYDTASDAKSMRDEDTTIDYSGGRQHSPSSGPKSLESASMRDVGSVKEAALLKATVESLRAGIREKEDAVTDLVSESFLTMVRWPCR